MGECVRFPATLSEGERPIVLGGVRKRRGWIPGGDRGPAAAADRRSVHMLGKLKPFIGPAITTIVVLVLVNRVGFLRNLVYGAK